MKIVINKCYGGFGLSALAVQELAKRKGRKCYFFEHGRDEKGTLELGRYVPLTLSEAEKSFMFSAFDIPNPNDVLISTKDWHTMPLKARAAANKKHEKHQLDAGRGLDRADADLVSVVETLGEKANGRHAELRVVEIPDGVDYEIDEYDGIESVHEKHQVWG